MNFTESEEIRFVDKFLQALMREGGVAEYGKILSVKYRLDGAYDCYNKLSVVINKDPHKFIEIRPGYGGGDIQITDLGKSVAKMGFNNYLKSLSDKEKEQEKQAKNDKFYKKWTFWVGVIAMAIIAILGLIFSLK